MAIRDPEFNNNFNQTSINSTSQAKQLPDVFEELKRSRYQSQMEQIEKKSPYRRYLSLLGVAVVLLIIALTFSLSTQSTTLANNDDTTTSSSFVSSNQEVTVEVNRHRMNAHNIITANSAIEIVKEQVVEEREIPFETLETPRNTLPKDEKVVLQNGINGKKNVTVVKTYQNGEYQEESILKEEKTLDFLPQIVDVGTSEYLAKIKAHLKDTLYLTVDSSLRENPDDTSTELAQVKRYLDVTLLDLPTEDWCKVSYEGIEGYIPSKNLTSSTATPTILEKNRIQKILVKVNIEMPLNQSSGLTLADFKKILTGFSYDKNNVFANNYEAFYNADKNYNINGVFLAALAIHESNWGTSQISIDKKNLFGYAAYDETPYESSTKFDTYADGIDLVARALVKYYLNPVGTKIYDNQTALSWYYNGPTVTAVNKRYASDENWSQAVYNYMEILYKKLG